MKRIKSKLAACALMGASIGSAAELTSPMSCRVSCHKLRIEPLPIARSWWPVFAHSFVTTTDRPIAMTTWGHDQRNLLSHITSNPTRAYLGAVTNPLPHPYPQTVRPCTLHIRTLSCTLIRSASALSLTACWDGSQCQRSVELRVAGRSTAGVCPVLASLLTAAARACEYACHGFPRMHM